MGRLKKTLYEIASCAVFSVPVWICIATIVIFTVIGISLRRNISASAEKEDSTPEPKYTGSLYREDNSSQVPTEDVSLEVGIPSLDRVSWDSPSYAETYVNWKVKLSIVEGELSKEFTPLKEHAALEGEPEAFISEANEYFKKLQELPVFIELFEYAKASSYATNNYYCTLTAESADSSAQLTLMCGMDDSQTVGVVITRNPYLDGALDRSVLSSISTDLNTMAGIVFNASELDKAIQYVKRTAMSGGAMFADIQDEVKGTTVQISVQNCETDEESWSFSCSRSLNGDASIAEGFVGIN